MTQRKINALNALGFQWAKRKGDTSWNEKFQELKQYREEHGNCKLSTILWVQAFVRNVPLKLSIPISGIGEVPTKYPKNPALGRWVSTQVCERPQTIIQKETLFLS